MVNSPISIPLAISQSRKPSDLFKAQALAADALKIERYINSQMNQEYIRQFDFSALAQALSLDQERVQGLLNRLASNSSEITVRNPNNKPRTPGALQNGRTESEGGGSAPATPSAMSNNRRQCWPTQTGVTEQR